MSDWKARLEAVAALGAPKVYPDGEVRCLNPTCNNEKLNRSDRTCWKCGADRFAPASDEMRHALRFNYVPPPRMVEKPKAEPPKAAAGITPFQKSLADYFQHATQQAYEQAYAQGLANAITRQQWTTIVWDEPKPGKGIIRRIADLLGYPR